MITEIGAFMVKGAGQELVHELHDDKNILGIFVEAGRTEDLFAFREFGSLRRMTLSPYWSRTVTPPAYLI